MTRKFIFSTQKLYCLHSNAFRLLISTTNEIFANFHVAPTQYRIEKWIARSLFDSIIRFFLSIIYRHSQNVTHHWVLDELNVVFLTIVLSLIWFKWIFLLVLTHSLYYNVVHVKIKCLNYNENLIVKTGHAIRAKYIFRASINSIGHIVISILTAISSNWNKTVILKPKPFVWIPGRFMVILLFAHSRNLIYI